MTREEIHATLREATEALWLPNLGGHTRERDYSHEHIPTRWPNKHRLWKLRDGWRHAVAMILRRHTLAYQAMIRESHVKGGLASRDVGSTAAACEAAARVRRSLSDAQVIQIRTEFAARGGNLSPRGTLTALATKHQLHKVLLGKLVRGDTYAHLPGAIPKRGRFGVKLESGDDLVTEAERPDDE